MNTYANELKLPGTPNGLGDPYVLRHNGRYYLYPSTHGDESGVHVWVSEDLVNWEDGGWVTRDACLKHCYAPEVYYHNGQFLLVGSPFGRGHFLYRSGSPLGPFTKVLDNFGLVIDGSLFADDDAQIYFTHAEYPCIYGHKMSLDGQMRQTTVMHGTGMGHWTEGPGIFKRQGKYYITMTGNHLLSRAYRIDYAISDVGPLGPYRVPEQKTLLVNTDRAHGSLGHSSNTIGPDLDSYWICYHNFEIDERGRHTRRNANLDRMLFNGEKLMVSGPTRHFVEAPGRPDAWGWADECRDAFLPWGDGVQLKRRAPGQFTAEINLVPAESAEVCFGYRDEENYGWVRIRNDRLALGAVEGGKERALAEKALFDGFDARVLHTVRLEMRMGKLNVLIDQMNQILDAEAPCAAGAIGARGAGRISYVAFSRHVAQRSDFEHYHALPGAIDAAMFLPASASRLSAGHPKEACGFRPEDGMRLQPGRDGAEDLVLSQGEYAGYRANAKSAGMAHLQAVVKSEGGAELQLQFQSGALTARIPPTRGFENIELAVLALPQGMQNFEVRALKGELVLSRFELFPVAAALKGEWSGLPLCFVAHQVEGLGSDGFLARYEGLQMDREVQAMGIFGERFLVNGFIEADIRFRGDGAEKSAGLFLRLSENSYHTDQILVGHRGYYVGFDTKGVRIDRMNFDAKTIASAPCALETERVYRIKAGIEGGRIEVYLDGRQIISAYEPDPLPYGQLAVGSFGSRITVERVAVDAR